MSLHGSVFGCTMIAFRIELRDGERVYIAESEYAYTSSRYGKTVTVPIGYESDGATRAMDIASAGWWGHDVLCSEGKWDDGTPVTNWQASSVLADILASEGRWFRARYWWLFTWLFGGGKARENGMV